MRKQYLKSLSRNVADPFWWNWRLHELLILFKSMLLMLFLWLLLGCDDSTTVNYWQRLPGMNLQVLSMWCNPNGIIYISNTGGVYVSTDNGTTWNRRREGPQDGNYIYSFTGTLNGYIFAGGWGVIRTSNEGVNWERGYNGGDWGDVVSLLSDDNNLFAGTSASGIRKGSLFKSTDMGNTFTENISGIPDSIEIVNAIAKSASGSIYIATQRAGLYRSVDHGNTWVKFTSFPNSYIGCLSLVGKTTIYAGGSNLYRSIDNGNSWTTIYYGSNSAISTIISTQNGNIFIGTTNDGIFYSNNYGNSWSSLNEGLSLIPRHHDQSSILPSIHFLMLDSSKYIYVGVNDDALYKSINPIR